MTDDVQAADDTTAAAPQVQTQAATASETQYGTVTQKDIETEKLEKKVAQAAARPDMQGNPFFEVISAKDVTKEEKRDAIAELLTYNEDQTPEENKKRLSQYDLFKQYMMSELTDRSVEIIKATDQRNLVELQEMFIEIQESVIGYEDSMAVPKKIFAALSKVRTEGGARMLTDIYRAFAIDDATEAKFNEDLAQKKASVESKQSELDSNRKELAKLREDTNFLGMTKGKNKSRIATLEAQTERLKDELEGVENKDGTRTGGLKAECKAFEEAGWEEQYPQYHDEKAVLRELKELSGEEWTARSQAIIDDAVNFVNTLDQRGNVVLDAQLRKRDHIDDLDSMTDKMKGVYSVLDDAERTASQANITLRQKLDTAPADESSIDKDARERKLKAVDLYVTTAAQSEVDTQRVRGFLEQDGVTVGQFRTNLDNKIADARDLIGSTKAQVSTGLALTINAVGAAATDAAELMAQDATVTIQEENAQTLKEEMERNGGAALEQAEKIRAAAEAMSQFEQSMMEITKKTEEGIKQRADAMEASEEARQRLAEQVKMLEGAVARSTEFNDVAAPAANDDAAAPATAPAAPAKKKTDLGDALKDF